MKDQRQALTIPLATGMDTGTDPQLVDKNNLIVWNAETCRSRAVGRRPGTVQIAGTYTAMKFVAEINDAMIVGGEAATRISTGDPSDPTLVNAASSGVPVPFCKVDIKRIGTSESTSNATYVACAENDTFLLVASWFNATDTSVEYDIIEKATGRGYGSGSVYYSWCPPQCVCTDNGTLLLVLGPNDTTGAMGGLIFDSAGQSSVFSITFDTSFPQPDSGLLDVAPIGGDLIAIGLRDDAADESLCVVVDTSTMTQTGAHYQDGTVASISACAVCKWPGSAGKYLFLYYTTAGTPDALHGVVLNSTTGDVEYTADDLSSTDLNSLVHLTCGTADADAEEVIVFWDTKVGNSPPLVKMVTVTPTTGGAVSFGSPIHVGQAVNLFAKPICDKTNDDLYLPVYFQGGRWWATTATDLDTGTVQRHYYVIKIETGSINTRPTAAKFLQWRAGHDVASLITGAATMLNYSSVGGIGNYADQVAYVPALEKSRQSDGRSGVALAKVTIDFDDLRPVNAHGQLFVPCAWPTCHEGKRDYLDPAIEVYPDTIVTATSGAGGTWGQAGSVGFAVEFQRRTARGLVVRGVPSWVERQAVAATQGVTVTYQTLDLHIRGQDNLRALIYATELDLAQYFQVISGTVYDTTNRTKTTAAYNGDAVLFLEDGDGNYQAAANALYTQDGVLECITPNHHYIACVWANRYWYVDGDQPETTIRPSREFEPGYQVPFTDVFDITLEAEGGEFTMLAAFGDRLVIGKASRVYVLMGQGPDPTGGTNAWDKPRLISESIGCTNINSVVVTPAGVAFLSSMGIVTLDRGEQLSPIGDPVSYFTDNYTISGAVCVPEKSVAIWATSDGPALVWDYSANIWAVWGGNYDSVRKIGYAGGRIYLLKGANLFVDDSATYADAGESYQFRTRTQWIKPAGVSGYIEAKRAILHGYNLNRGKIHVAVAFDYVPAFTEVELSLAGVQAITQADHYAVPGLSVAGYDKQALIAHIPIPRHKITSICFDIWDEDCAEETFELTAISLVAEPKGRPDAPIGSDKRFTEV